MNKVYLFGAGKSAYGVIEYIGREHIIALIDNNEQLQGCSVLEIRIISLQQYIKENNGEEIIITPAICDSIISQLKANNINNYSMAPLITLGNILNPEQIYFRCKNKQELYIIGNDIVMRKFCDYIKNNHNECRLNIISRYLNNYIYDIKVVDYNKIPLHADILIFKEKLDNDEQDLLAKHDNKQFVYEIKEEKHYKKLRRFKDLYQGEKCFIVGNGPSLRVNDLDLIAQNNIQSFGFNLIYNMYSDTKWRASYIVITDYTVYRTYYDDIKKLNKRNLFIKDFYQIEGTPYIKNVNYYPASAYRLYNQKQEFSTDITQNVFGAYSVMYDALQIAIYMGFKEIYLIGADFSYENDATRKGNHVYDYKFKDKRKNAGPMYIETTFHALELSRQYADKHGIKIYNATRGGKLEIFKRIDFDSLFEN